MPNEKKILLVIVAIGLMLSVAGFFPLGRPVGPLPI